MVPDSHAQLKQTPKTTRDPRAKILSFAALALGLASAKTLTAAGLALILGLVVFALSRTPIFYLYRAIKLPLILALPLVLIVSLSSGGESWASIAGATIYYDGLRLGCRILMVMLALLTLTAAFFAQWPLSHAIQGLSRLGIGDKFLFLVLFSYRYIYILRKKIQRMKTALILRGYRPGFFAWLGSVHLIGSLLLHSYDQTERLYRAMTLRGFSGTMAKGQKLPFRLLDWLWTLLAFVAGSTVIWVSYYGPSN